MDYNSALSVASFFENEKFIVKLFEGVFNLTKSRYEKEVEDKGIEKAIPLSLYNKEFGSLNVNYNDLIRVFAEIFSENDLVSIEKILDDFLLDNHTKKTYEMKMQEAEKNKKRFFLIASIMQNIMGLTYVYSNKINATNLKGIVKVSKDFYTDILYKVNDNHVQFVIVPLNVEVFKSYGLSDSFIDEIEEFFDKIEYEQVAYSKNKCVKFWKENSEISKKIYE